MTEDVIQLLTPEGHLTEHPDYPLDIDAGLLRTLYRDIVLTRRTDVESTALQRTGELGLWCPVLGQEGVQIGAGHAMRPSDYGFTTYREVGIFHVRGVDPVELLEVQLCNSVAPFVLVSRLRPALAKSPARRTYVVNVSAMEGQFSRRYKGAGHPHTNMAMAALNMMTRTSAGEMFETDRILMNAVDTGWITDERPHQDKLRIAAEGWHAPLDLVDGAARVYDPVVRGEAGEDLHGHFLKDYRPSPW